MNQQILSQDEVDALLQGITGESQKLEQEEAPTDGIRAYDLASQERIVRGRMPTMEIINERFARNIRVGLFNMIRKSPEVSIGGIKVQKYSAFLREIVVPTNFNIMQVRPLRGSGLIVCDPSIVFAIIDSLFGGSGKFHTRIEGRDFSATEQRVIERLVACISEEYKRAWRGIYPLELDYQRSEMQPQFANVATPSEIVVATSFTLEIGETSGSVHFCIPYSTLEPIRDVLYSSMQGDSVVPPDVEAARLREQKLLASYKPTDISKHTIDSETEAVANLVMKAYDNDRNWEPVVTKTGENHWEVTELRPKPRKERYDEEKTVKAAMTESEKMVIPRPSIQIDDRIRGDPYFDKSGVQDNDNSRFWNYNDFRKWTPGLERMFAPTDSNREWF